MTREPTTNSVEYQIVRNSGRRYLPEGITHASDRLHELSLEGTIDLVAQAAHEDVDDIGLRIEIVFPDVRENHGLRDDLAGITHQIFEQRELTRTKIDRDAAAGHLSSEQI